MIKNESHFALLVYFRHVVKTRYPELEEALKRWHQNPNYNFAELILAHEAKSHAA